MSSFLRDVGAETGATTAAFDDAAVIRHALAFEAGLAKSLAAEGVITAQSGTAIAAACAAIKIDPATLASGAAHAGTLAIPLVEALRNHLRSADPEAARDVHRGATSQDLADTVLVLQLKDATSAITHDLAKLRTVLRDLTSAHAATPMLGRTLLQPALPITFGLKTAGWMTAVHDSQRRVRNDAKAALVLQFGGPVGTLNGLNGKGLAVAARLGTELGLPHHALPWHSRRDALVTLGASLGTVIGSVGKIARDIALCAQGEIGELREPAGAGRGGSSAMTHKRNPTGCQVALSAALRAPGLVATLLTAMVGEHERGLGGWQVEAPVLADLCSLAHRAITEMLTVVSGLEVDTAAMRRNLDRADVGQDIGESETLVANALRDIAEDR